MECEVTSKTYKEIQVTLAVAKLAGEMELHGKTLGFYLTALTAAQIAAGESKVRTLIVEAESVKVTKAAGSAWTPGDPIFWLETTSNFTNVDDGSGKLIGKAAKVAAENAVEGFILMRDYYPVQRGHQIGTAVVPYKIAADDPLLAAYTTSAVAAGDVISAIIKQVRTVAASGSSKVLRVDLESNVKIANIANLYSKIDFKTAGCVQGLASALCGEMRMASGAGVVTGSYTILELELGVYGVNTANYKTSLITANVWGSAAGKANFDLYGYFLNLNCESAGSGAFVNTDKNSVNGGIRIVINGAVKWLCYAD